MWLSKESINKTSLMQFSSILSDSTTPKKNECCVLILSYDSFSNENNNKSYISFKIYWVYLS
jgi:hypothetical protein